MARSKSGKHPAARRLSRHQKRVLEYVAAGQRRRPSSNLEIAELVSEGLAEPEYLLAVLKKLGEECSPEQAVRISARIKEMAQT